MTTTVNHVSVYVFASTLSKETKEQGGVYTSKQASHKPAAEHKAFSASSLRSFCYFSKQQMRKSAIREHLTQAAGSLLDEKQISRDPQT